MANVNCEACTEIRELDPNLVANGWSNTECTSFKNDTGLDPSNGHNDCTDLELMNDCLIGNLDVEVDKYEVCDWKEFMHKFLPNLWTMLSAIKCALCGIWTNIHNLWAEIQRIWNKINEILAEIQRIWNKITEILNDLTQIWNNIRNINALVSKLQCYTNFLLNSHDVSALIDASNFVAGTGVSFNRQDDLAILPSLIINGSTYTVSGSIRVSLNNSHWKNLGLDNDGDSVSNHKINTPSGNYTLCVVKIPKSQFPWLKTMSSCVGQFVNAGSAQLFIQVRDEGDTYPGQWGNSESSDVTVPSGQIHVRVALSSLTTWGIEYNASDDYADVTFRATGLAYTNPQGIQC